MKNNLQISVYMHHNTLFILNVLIKHLGTNKRNITSEVIDNYLLSGLEHILSPKKQNSQIKYINYKQNLFKLGFLKLNPLSNMNFVQLHHNTKITAVVNPIQENILTDITKNLKDNNIIISKSTLLHEALVQFIEENISLIQNSIYENVLLLIKQNKQDTKNELLPIIKSYKTERKRKSFA